jgi:hypothetical protein
VLQPRQHLICRSTRTIKTRMMLILDLRTDDDSESREFLSIGITLDEPVSGRGIHSTIELRPPGLAIEI